MNARGRATAGPTAAAPRPLIAGGRLRTAVLGDGGFGTAMAMTLLDAGHDVVQWGIDPDYLKAMERDRENSRYLPGIALPGALRFNPDPLSAARDADWVFVAIPTQYLRAALPPWPAPADRAHPGDEGAPPVVVLAKGIEQDTLKRPSEIVAELWRPARLAVLSGPSHAEEVARKLPSTLVAASADGEFARAVQAACSTTAFRVYTSSDPVGVELCGALKNVLAIAAGISQGLGLGDNALAALVTRGIAEIRRLGAKVGAHPETFAGLAGIGDAMTTCYSPHGRNRAVGLDIAAGRTLESVMAGRKTVAEGVATSRAALELSRRLGAPMPIVEQVCAVLFDGADPRESAFRLMLRDPVAEN